ncbi:MAG: universal stress protein [Kofleriaceae bacterium]
MQIQRLIVGVDFSPSSQVAVARAAELAATHGAELVLVHAGTVPETPEVPPSMAATRDAYLAVLQDQLAADRARLAQLHADLVARGVQASQVIVDRFPDDALVEAADEFKADLILTGTRDAGERHGHGRWRLGKVTAKVVRAAHTSVLCARAGDPDHGFSRIVVGTDFSDAAAHALALAVAVAAPGATIEVVHALQVGRWPEAVATPVRLVDDHPIRVELAAALEARGAALLAPYQGRDVTLSFRVGFDEPHVAVRAAALAAEADLVAVGGVGHRGLRRWLLGSVAEDILADAPCSVLIAR